MSDISTKDPRFLLRYAKPEDAALVVEYMRKLGTYQKMLDSITVTEADMHRLLASQGSEALLGIYEGEIVGFAYFYQNSSAFTGQSGLYIDGFLIDSTMRGLGLGKIMLAFLSKLTLERGCKRLEWGCLNWNEPAIRFYRKMGAYSVDEMTVYRFKPEQLEKNAEIF